MLRLKTAGIFFLLIFAIALSSCSKSKIFTEIDFSFKSLDDIYPLKFVGLDAEIRKSIPGYRKGLQCEDYRLGGFGAKASLEVCQCSDSGNCKKNWDYLVEQKREEKLTDFSEVSGNEWRFDYVEESGIAGLIWTNKSFLFQAEAESEKLLRSFLAGSEIAKLD